MLFPKIIILAQGGSHGDFLHRCCDLMLHDNKIKINDAGRVMPTSVLKYNHFYHAGKKIPITEEKLKKLNLSTVELSHVWHEEFIDWPSKFHYIHIEEECIPVVIKMFLSKICNNDEKIAMEQFLSFFPLDVKARINNVSFQIFCKNMMLRIQKKFQKQPSISKIRITDLYSFDSLVKTLTMMNCFDHKKSKILEQIHSEWTEKNKSYIDEIHYISSNK